MENDIHTIKKRSVSGVIAFTVRTIALQFIGFFASLLLAALLEPSEFGVFFLVSSIVSLFVFLSDIGLAASLIQKKTPPTSEDLGTAFTVQQLLAILIFVSIILLQPLWRDYFGLSESATGLLFALGFSFILASLKTIPSILLERELEFNKLVIPQIIENIVFYAVVVFLAWRDFGVDSYTYAVLLRGLVGLVTIYALKPWIPRIIISKDSLKHLMHFGVPFQANDLLARIKDDLLLVVLKRFLTVAEIGYLGWAQRLSLYPFRFTVDSVIRVTFPAYSRLQHHPEELQKAIEKTIFFISLIIFPLLAGLAAMAYPLTVVIPEYEKWQPMLPALYFFIINVAFSAISTPLTNALNAIGKIRITLNLMVFWTATTWLFTIPLILKYGFVGAAIAAALVSSTSIVTIRIIQKHLPVRVFENIIFQGIAALIMLLIIVQLQAYATNSLLHLVQVIILGGLIYSSVILIVMRDKVFIELKKIYALRHA